MDTADSKDIPFLKELHFEATHNFGICSFGITISDGQYLGSRLKEPSKVQVPRNVKRAEISFFRDERYVYNISFYTHDGKVIRLRENNAAFGPGRTEVVDLRADEVLLGCEIECGIPHHTNPDAYGVTWLIWRPLGQETQKTGTP